jgi:hypothetical protein
MTADEVRARLDAQSEGRWTATSDGSEWLLRRTRMEEDVSFELHDGQLMAIRAHTIATPSLAGPTYEVTPGSVLHREIDGDRILWTLVSRACPTHREEAEALVRAAAAASP